MSKADAFETLIDAIAEQTGKPRGLCRSLITELGSEIARAAVEEDKVEIEGLGTFFLTKEDTERDDEPRQSDSEKLTFQPAKDLQELVNAPYAHMQPEIIEEEPAPDTSGEKRTGETDGNDLPPATDTPEDAFPGGDPTAGSSLSFSKRYQRKEKSQSTFWVIAAAFIILLLAVGAWYMLGLMSENQGLPEQTAVGEMQDDAPDNSQSQPAASETSQESEDERKATGEQEQLSAAGQQPQGDNPSTDTATDSSDDRPDESNQVITITVERGQTLWGLADKQYTNPYLWPWIYDTNIDRIDDPDIIYVGQPLDIPLRSGAGGLSQGDSLQVALAYVETYLWYKERELENARFYLYAAKRYHHRVFEVTDAELDPADLRFANRAR